MICIVWVTVHITGLNSAGQPDKTAAILVATLSPEMYTGKARAAYQVAKEIPEILVELPCFCGCVDSLGHRNNLYCFTTPTGPSAMNARILRSVPRKCIGREFRFPRSATASVPRTDTPSRHSGKAGHQALRLRMNSGMAIIASRYGDGGNFSSAIVA